MIITAELVAQAGQMGLVTQREIGDGLVGVRELDGDRLLTVTVHSHPVAYVRREPTSCASSGGVLDRERAVLSAVRDTDCVPQVLAGSPEESLWLSVLDGAELSEQRRNMAEYAEICQAWGATLGRLHTLPVRFSGRWTAPRPEVLDTRQLARTVRTAGARSGAASGSRPSASAHRKRATEAQQPRIYPPDLSPPHRDHMWSARWRSPESAHDLTTV